MIGLCLFIQHSVVFGTVLTRRCRGYGRIATASLQAIALPYLVEKNNKKKERHANDLRDILFVMEYPCLRSVSKL